jgi:hypothetical protein
MKKVTILAIVAASVSWPCIAASATAQAQQQPVWPPHPTQAHGHITRIQAGPPCTKVWFDDGSIWALVPDGFNYESRVTTLNTYWSLGIVVWVRTPDDPTISQFHLTQPAMVPCNSQDAAGHPTVEWLPNTVGTYVDNPYIPSY